ncbi:hypothetical protein ACFYTF_29220 [Nocardia thailandica]|uniref:Uncharacterized protein n=1 Tax=Nocardia thailandica TaxID=257275 RepID=A0ABW6PWV2_9NOCA
MADQTFTTDDIALGIEIPGVYDGVCCWLLKDGRIVNRWTRGPSARYEATQQWIEANGAALRAANTDLLDRTETTQ